jgi:hypothetical protein
MAHPTDKYARVVRFVRQHLLEPPTDADDKPIPLRTLRLMRLSDDHRQSDKKGEWSIRDSMNADDIARTVLDKAQDIANEYQRAIDFNVEAYHGVGVSDPNDSTPLRMVGHKTIRAGEKTITDPVGLGTFDEPATKQGSDALELRHREANGRANLEHNKLMFDVQRGLIEQLQKTVRDQFQQIQELIKKNTDLNFELEKSRDRQNEREIRQFQAVQREKRFDELLRNAMVFFPIIVNRIAGTRLMAEGSYNGILEGAKLLVKSITSDEKRFEEIRSKLTDAEQFAFMDMSQMLMSEEMKAQEQAEQEAKTKMAEMRDPKVLAELQARGSRAVEAAP